MGGWGWAGTDESKRAAAGRRLVIVSLYYAPEPSGNAPYVAGVAEHLASVGWDVTVIAGMPHYPRWRIAPGYQGRLRSREVLNEVDVRRFRTYVPASQSTSKRALYELSFLVQAFTSAVPSADAVVGVVPSLTGGYLAKSFARRLGRPYGLWLQDLVGKGAVQSGLSSHSTASLIARMEERMVRSAARVGIVSSDFRDTVVSYGLPPERVVDLPNWNLTPPPGSGPEHLREELGLASVGTMVLHAGNMGNKQGLENVIAAAAEAQRDHPYLRFVLMGDGSQRDRLCRLARELPNVTFLGSQEPQRHADILAAADVLLINERVGVLDMSLPSKLTSYLAAGRPIVAAVGATGSTASAVTETGAGIVVPPGDPRALLEAIAQVAADEGLRRRLGDAGFAYSRTQQDAATAMARAERFMEDLIRDGR